MKAMNIGPFLKKLREEKGLSKEEAAAQLGTTKGFISVWESGLCMPRLNVLIQIANLYDISVDEIVEGKRQPPGSSRYYEKHNDIYENVDRYVTERSEMILRRLCGVVVAWIVFVLVAVAGEELERFFEWIDGGRVHECCEMISYLFLAVIGEFLAGEYFEAERNKTERILCCATMVAIFGIVIGRLIF